MRRLVFSLMVAGALLLAMASLASAAPLAQDPEPEEVEFTGTVESLDPFVVDGTTVVLDDVTQVEGNPAVGDIVEVKGTRQEDGSVLATRVKVEAAAEEGEPVDEARPEGSLHPMGQMLSELMGVDYDEIMELFRSGVGFGRILRAWTLFQMLGSESLDWEALLARHMDGQGWGEVIVAVKMAERLGDPELTAEALLELHDEGMGWGTLHQAQRAAGELEMSMSEVLDLSESWDVSVSDLRQAARLAEAYADRGATLDSILEMRAAGKDWGQIRRYWRGERERGPRSDRGPFGGGED
ncbi:MAG: hypothetical protein HYZ68_00120 [Chloroflexi bacterium]|nr:hypothetical protein [Chloroflexota bacterium]